MPAERSYLFLQGSASQFFNLLGRALLEKGHPVHRVNFNGGDQLFWRLPGAVSYRWGLKGWAEFLEAHLTKWTVTDIVLFGDCRPLHREAVRIAKLRGIRVYVFDEGYIRPNWMTMELGGVNGFSMLPHDPAWFRAAAARLPAFNGGSPVVSNFSRRAFEDVAYNVATASLMLLYPGYSTHRPWHPFIEYGGWLLRFSRKSAVRRRVAAGLARLATLKRPYFFFPLQLDCDSQIRHHSSIGRIAPAIHHVIASFARHAPADRILVLKEHPLDNALTNWRVMTARIAAKAGVGNRVIYLEDANLDSLLSHCEGVVTINSTVGFLALAHGKPVVTLGDAIYDMQDLTFQGMLDDFWTSCTAPDPETFDALRRVAVARTQVNGGFFSREGLDLAVAGTLARLEQTLPEAVIMPMPTAAGGLPVENTAAARNKRTRAG